MKLSEIITHCVDHLADQYLLFSKFEKPYISIVDNLDNLKDNCFPYVVKNSGEVNLEYLYYYLRLHMKLLRVPESDGNVGRYGLDHLSIDFINNIILPALPEQSVWMNIEKQNLLVGFIKRLYELSIENIDSKIDRLRNVKSQHMIQTLCQRMEMNSSELYKIKDMKLFFKNVKKGKLQNLVTDYIEILNPNILDRDFLVLYLYYTKDLDNPTNYYRVEDESKFGEFHTRYINIPMLSLHEQRVTMSFILTTHIEIGKLRTELRANKLALRKLVDEA